jgi:hypothetical protein
MERIENLEEFLGNHLNEKDHYKDKKIRNNYADKIGPSLRKAEDPESKDVTKFFDIHKEKMAMSLDEDEKNTKELCEAEIERLQKKMEEEGADKKKISAKIKKVESYMNSTLKQIKEEKSKYKSFFSSKPKIIIN